MTAEHPIDILIKSLHAGRVLDVATGGGAMLEWLARDLASFEHMTGIDLRALDAATLDDDHIFNHPQIDYLHMDAHALNFPDASFDTVTIANSLHHLHDPGRALAEMWRVLAPGGRLIVQEMFRDGQTETQMTHVLMHHWWAAIDRAHGITHNETYTRAGLIALLEPLRPARLTLHDYADLASDPRAVETLGALQARLRQYTARIDGLPGADDLRAQADALAQRLIAVGFHSATALFAVLEKSLV